MVNFGTDLVGMGGRSSGTYSSEARPRPKAVVSLRKFTRFQDARYINNRGPCPATLGNDRIDHAVHKNSIFSGNNYIFDLHGPFKVVKQPVRHLITAEPAQNKFSIFVGFSLCLESLFIRVRLKNTFENHFFLQAVYGM